MATDLTTGSIAFTGFSVDTSDSADTLQFAALTDIAAGTVISFNAGTWNGTSFAKGGDTWTWTATEDVAAGTVITMDALNSADPTSNHGDIAGTPTSGLHVTDFDIVYAYTGTANAPNFLSAISGGPLTGSSSTPATLNGTGLVAGQTAISLASDQNHTVDIGLYTGPHIGSANFSDYLSDINNPANWTFQQYSGGKGEHDGVGPDAPLSQAGFSTDPHAQSVSFDANSLSISQAEGDSGDTIMTFTVVRSGDNTDGELDFSGVINIDGKPLLTGGDFNQPLTFSGTIADGQTTGTVSIHIKGDTTFEGNETFTLVLNEASNAAHPVILGDHTLATGTIVNDDAGPKIAFTGINTDGGDALTFATFTDIAAGTVIRFHGNADGAISDWSWTASENITAGSIISMDGLSSGAATSNHGTIAFTSGTKIDIDSFGGSILAYMGDAGQPTGYLTGIALGSLGNLSNIGLFAGINAVQLQATGIAEYIGPRVGLTSYDDYIKAINNPANWVFGPHGADGAAPDTPFPAYGFSIDQTAQQVDFAASSVKVSHNEGNNGATTTFTFTVERTNGTTGDLHFTVGVASEHIDGVADASDFGGTLPVIDGVIADGQSSTTVSITVTGDSLYEASEIFHLVFQSASNAQANVVIGANTTATGTITNDDTEPGEILSGQVVTVPLTLTGTDSVTIDAGAKLDVSGQVTNPAAITSSSGNGTVDISGDLITTNQAAGVAILASKNTTSLAITVHEGATDFGEFDMHKGPTSAVITITNSGTISSHTKTIEMADAVAPGQDWIHNLAGGVITSDSAANDVIRGGQNNEIDNAGTIISADDPSPTITGSDAINFQSKTGGVVHNETGGLIEGSHHAITGNEGVTVFNDAGATLIGRNGSGVNIDNDATVANTVHVTNHGDIFGESAGYTDSDGDAIDVDGLLQLDNYGNVKGLGANGYHDGTLAIDANISEGIAIGGGSIHNYQDALIYGYGRAIEIDNSSNGPAATATTIINEGTIQGDGHGPTGVAAADAVTMQAQIDGAEAINIHGSFADTITNTETGVIKGGISTDGGNDILSNAGSITALAGSAVNLGDGDDMLTNTGTINGTVLLGAGDDTFNASTGSTTTGLIDGGDGNDTINLEGTGTGTLGAIVNVEVVDVDSGAWTLGSDSASEIDLAAGVQTIGFAAATTADGSVGSVIKGFGIGDAIDLQGVGTATKVVLGAGNVLTVTTANGPVTMQLDPTHDYTGTVFTVAADGQGGTVVKNVAPTQTVGFPSSPYTIIVAETDDGTFSVTLTVQRTGGTTGDLSFSGTLFTSDNINDPLEGADFPGGQLPAGTFSGVIPDGQTSTTITLTFEGDTLPEPNEGFEYFISSASNADAQSVKIGAATAIGVVQDNDWTSIESGQTVTESVGLPTVANFTIEKGGVLDASAFGEIEMSGPNLDLNITNYGYIGGKTGLIGSSSNPGGHIVFNNEAGAEEHAQIKFGTWGAGSQIEIDNAGLITDATSKTIDVSSIPTTVTVTINNLAGGIITNELATDVIEAGTNVHINNAGQIVDPADPAGTTDPTGDAINYGSKAGGVVHNEAGGLIEGSHHAVTGSAGITVINDAGGTMIGRNGSAVNMDNNASVANTAFITNYGDMEGRSGGYADSDGDAVDVDGLLVVKNYGMIQGLGANGTHDGGANVSEGIAVGGGEIDNYAGGTIYGYGRAIQVDNSAEGPALGATTIYNEGLIQGDGHGPQNFDAGSDVGIVLENREAIDIIGTFADTITNKGQIVGGVFTDRGNDVFNAYAGSTTTGLIDGGDGNDTLNLMGSGLGTLGRNQNFENLNVEGGSWMIQSAAYADVTVATGATLMSRVDLADQGQMAVSAGGIVLVTNGDDAIVAGGSAMVSNSGAILGIGTNARAIVIDGGSVDNASGATITANGAAIASGNAPAAGVVITNEGVIQSLSGQAIALTGDENDTLSNQGQILGSVSLGGGDDILNVSVGSAITGAIDLGAGNDTVHLLGNGTGTLGAVANAETLDIDSGTWSVTGAGAYHTIDIAAGATLTSAVAVTDSIEVTVGGTLDPASGRAIDAKNGLADGSTFTVNVLAGGQIVANDDAVRINDDFDNGTVTVDNAGLIQATGGQALDFTEVTSKSTAITITNEAGGVLLGVDADAVRAGGNSIINNYGQISSTATGDDVNDGIDFQDKGDGTVHNYAGGTIIAAHHGVTGSQGITVINDLGGTIIGQSGSAVNIDSDSAVADMVTVVNHGVMLGEADANQSDSDGDAVDVDGLLNLDNSGQISGLGAHGYHDGTAATDANISEGVAAGGGTIINEAGATIFGYGRAIQIDDSSNGGAFASTIITNDGLIQGGGHGPEGVSDADAATMQARIDGAEAIDILGTQADTITNSATGQIIGGIFTDGGGDTLVNAGTITALAGSAVNMGDGDDLVTNTGAINGTVLLGAGDDTLNAYVGSSVTGAIDGGDGNDTVNLYATDGNTAMGVFGQTTNVETLNVVSGRWNLSYGFTGANIDVHGGAAIISGTSGIMTLEGGQTLTVEQGGLVQGAKTALFISLGEGDANIINSGTIDVTAAAGSDKADAISLNGATATIHNTSTGVIEGARHAITGPLGITVINDAGGLIVGENGSAVNMDNGASENVAAHVTNYGTMLGDSANISDSDGDAIDVDGLLHLDNYGSIRGEGANGYHKGEANVSEGLAIGGGTVHNYVGGEIYGYGRAIQVDNSSNGPDFAATTIINDGTIQGGGHGPTGVADADAAAMQARINGAEAIDILGTFADTITNTATGQIIGGIFTDGGADTLTNAGTITAMAGSAVNMGDGNDSVSNSGTITGTVLLGAGDDTFNASVGSRVTGTIDGGDGNDTIHLLGTGTGSLGAIANVENLDVDAGTWTVASVAGVSNIDIANGATVNSSLTLTGTQHLTVEEGGTLKGVTWAGTGSSSVVVDNYGDIQSIGPTSGVSGTLTINNHASGELLGAINMNGIATGANIVIDNDGLMEGQGNFAIRIARSGGATTEITNSSTGVITSTVASADVISWASNTHIDNYGKIVSADDTANSSGGTAIDFNSGLGNSLHNYDGGLIEGSHHAVSGKDVGMTVVNDEGGTMIGRNGSAVNVDNDAKVADTVFVTNHGTMLGESANTSDSDGDAVDVDGLLQLDNYGSIRGEGANGTHDGGANVSEGVAIGGGVINNYEGGEIYGYGRAIQVDNSAEGPALGATTIYNAGTIQGDGHGPTNFDPGSDVGIVLENREAIDILGTLADTITNTATGKIIGGIFTDGGDDHLSNAGLINGQIDMGDGNDTVSLSGDSQVTGMILLGTGNDTLTDTGHTAITVDAGAGNDTITVGTGNDTLIGGDGSDTFNYALGDGNDTIVEGAGQAGDVDSLVLTDIDGSGATLSRDGNDLDIVLSNGHTIVVKGQFDGGGVENITFHDGTVIDRDGIIDDTNHAPVVTSSTTAVTDEDTPLTGHVTATDADGDQLTYTLVPDNADHHGAFSIDGQGNWTYTPDHNYNGSDSFTVQVSDGHTTVDTTLDVTVNPVNDAPVTVNDVGTVSEHDTATFDLVANDTDVEDGHPALTGFSVTGVDGIDLSNDAASKAFQIVDGKLQFTGGDIFGALNDNDHATVTISYTAQDSGGAHTTGEFVLTIDGVTDQNPINGTGGSDVLFDTSGNDHIVAGDGNDIISTMSGSDVVDAGAGNDVVTAVSGNATVNGGEGNDTLIGGVGNTVLNGDAGNDTIIGGSGNEVLNGGAGNDTIIANGGDDRIIGGQGNDQLFGGPGSDTFVFKPADGQDTVFDFQASGASHDVVEVDSHSFADFNALMHAVHDTAAGAQLQYGDGSTLTLSGVDKAHLTMNDFHFA